MKIVIIGGGAAGVMAAVTASKNGAQVIIADGNEKIGKKLYITGKGRCNVTNMCEREEFFENIVNGKKFMFSAFKQFSNKDLYDFLETNGLKLKVERGNRAFPLSDKSADVIRCYTRLLEMSGIEVRLQTKVSEIICENGGVCAVKPIGGDIISADAVIVATGGASYKSTGSTGDGYRFAEKTGHNVISPRAALSAIILKENVSELEGLSLKNVKLSFVSGGKTLYSEIGEMLFTDTGISGPLALSGSSYITRNLQNGKVFVEIDLKPYIPEAELHERLLKDFAKYINKNFENALDDLLPKSMIKYFIKRTEISQYLKINSVTREMRQKMIEQLKKMRFEIKGLDDINRAIITSGGVDTKDINPNTMESKIVNGLYFAGEVLDVDALTGGFNLQVAFSTGYVAGKCAATKNNPID